jgi:hypothetical protein
LFDVGVEIGRHGEQALLDVREVDGLPHPR